MSTTSTSMSTDLATIRPVFTEPERLALAGYLAGYRGLTREAYTLDLRQFTNCAGDGPSPCSPSGGPISRPTPATWKPRAGPAPP